MAFVVLSNSLHQVFHRVDFGGGIFAYTFTCTNVKVMLTKVNMTKCLKRLNRVWYAK